MSRYLMKYKGTYRLKPNLDQFTNDFPRTDNESIDPSYDDIYIKCANGSQIYHYGHSTLVAYIPSIGRAHNIIIAIAKELKLINEDTESRDYEILYSKLNNNGTIFDIHEYDSEVEFKFNAKNVELVAKYLKPQTMGADISPFSTKNLPKKKYEIPLENIKEYREIIDSISEGNKLLINILTKEFMSKIMAKDTKLYNEINIKTDMKKRMLKGKEYIHNMGYWDKYLDYLRKNL